MTMERLQSIVWFSTPLIGLLLLVAFLGARGGIWFVVPIMLVGLVIGVFYGLLLWAQAHEREH